MLQFFSSGRNGSAGQLFRTGMMASSRKPRYIHASPDEYDDYPAGVPGGPRGIIRPRQTQRVRATDSDESSTVVLHNGSSRNRTPRTCPARRTEPEKMIVQVFDGSTTVSELVNGQFKCRRVTVFNMTTVNQLIEMLGAGSGWKILQFRKDHEGEFEQEFSIRYGSERADWTMEIFGWAKPRGSEEVNDVVLVLDQ